MGRFATATPADTGSWRRLGWFEKPKPGESVRSNFVGARPASVWDVSQTTGDPIPERPTPLLLGGKAPVGLWDGLAALMEAEGFAVLRVPHEGMIGGANGLTDYTARTVAVRENMPSAAQAKTLAHELAHVRLHGPNNPEASGHRGIGEVEAESVALMVGAAHGMGTSEYTIPYVSGWASTVKDKNPAEVVQATGERVRKTAGTILDEFFESLRHSSVTLADACGKVHQSYSDFVMLAALLAARSSEVSGLQAGDVHFGKNLVIIARQTFPGRGGLVTKQTKSRKERRVPILDALRPVLERLTAGKEPEDRLLVGPKGGALTTATVRDATNWDKIVDGLGLPDLTRHGLRHTGATWMADAGIPLHVLQEILGHASIETTRGYLHPDDRHLASAAEQANAFLAKATGTSTSPKRSGPSRSL